MDNNKCNSCNKIFKYKSYLTRHKNNKNKCYIDPSDEYPDVIENNNHVGINDEVTVNYNINDDNDDNTSNIDNTSNVDNILNSNKFSRLCNLVKDKVISNNNFLESLILESGDTNESKTLISLFKKESELLYTNITNNILNNKDNQNICSGCSKKFSDRQSLYRHNKHNRCKGNSESSTGTTFNDIINNIDNTVNNDNTINNDNTVNIDNSVNIDNTVNNNITNNIVININPFGYESFKNIKVGDLKHVFNNCKTLNYNLCNLMYLKNEGNMNFYKNNINKKIISFLTSNMEIQKISERDFTNELTFLIKDWCIELIYYFKNDLTETEILNYIKQIITLEFLLLTDKNMKHEYNDTITTIMDTVLRNEDVKKTIKNVVTKLQTNPELKEKYNKDNKMRRIDKQKRLSDYNNPPSNNINNKCLYNIKKKAIELNTNDYKQKLANTTNSNN